MSPSKRNKPDGSDWHQTVSRALLQLKLKANSARSSPSAKAAEDCRRAAGLFEASLAGLESGPSALQAAIEQVSAKDASSHQQQAKNLSDSVASFLEAFCAWKCTHGVGWHLLRPVLRLLLWLIPEHVFSPEPTAQAPAIEQADPAPPQGSGRRSQASDAHVDCRWREAFGVSFTLDVASPALSDACFNAMRVRVPDMHSSDLQAVREDGQILEESLVWLTVIRRLWVLAKELDDMPCAAVPASTIKPPPSAASLLGHLSHLPTLERNRVGLSLLVKHACFWVEGSCDTIQGQDRGAKQQAQCSWSRAGDRGSEFASWFKPDPHLAAVLGPWTQQPIVMMERIVAFLMSEIITLSQTPRASDYILFYPNIISFYQLMVCFFLLFITDRDYIPAPAFYRQHPTALLETNIRGLTLMWRLQLGSMCPMVRWAFTVEGVRHASRVIWLDFMDLWAVPGNPLPSMTHWQRRFLPAHISAGMGSEGHPLLMMLSSCDTFLQDVCSKHLYYYHRQERTAHASASADVLSAACAAAESLHLLMCAGDNARGSELTAEKMADAAGEIMISSVYLMRALQPASPEYFITERQQGNAWAQCLDTVIKLQFRHEERGDQAMKQLCLKERPMAARVLLEQVLPVLQHVATLLLGSSNTGAANSGRALGSAPSRSTAAAATLDTARDASTPLHHAGGGSDRHHHSGHTASSACAIPVDSTLVLLQAASMVIRQCMMCTDSDRAYKIMSRGLECTSGGAPSGVGQGASSSGSSSSSSRTAGAAQHNSKSAVSDDLAALWDVFLSLTSVLVSGGPLWQEAKAKHPVLLIEALYSLCRELSYAVTCTFEYARGCNLPLWAAIASWPAAGTLFSDINSKGPACPGMPAACSGGGVGDSTPANVSDLIVQLTLRLWELLCDESIVGAATAPAAWLPSIPHYMCTSTSGLATFYLDHLDQAAGSVVESTSAALIRTVAVFCALHPGNSSIGSSTTGAHTWNSPASQADVDRALHLASFYPRAKWEEVQAAPRHGCVRHSNEFNTKLECLREQLCTVPLLRAVCMLASVGLLTEQQKQGVVALLGGTPDRNSSSRGSSSPLFLLVEEPPELQQLRQSKGISLAELGVAMLWFDKCQAQMAKQESAMPFYNNSPVRMERGRYRTGAISSQLLALISPVQLPLIKRLYQTLSAADEEDGPPLRDEQVGVRPVVAELWHAGKLADAYLSWVQATLQGIIQGVLRQHRN